MSDNENNFEPDEIFEPLEKLSRDLLKKASRLTKQEVRFIVASYYTHQRARIGAENRIRSMVESPSEAFDWTFAQEERFEKRMLSLLNAYTAQSEIGQWLRNIKGIGPVIAAGLIAYTDMDKAVTVGHIWQIAGIAGDGQRPWLEKQKRPWNPKFKTLCYKIGESFVKLSNDPECPYGQMYKQRKEYEQAKNERGDYAAQAAIGATKVGKTTEAFKHYSAGHLPPGHIHSRCRRYATKIFLAHFHEAYYRQTYGTEPPLPYPIVFLNHAHKIVVAESRGFSQEEAVRFAGEN